MASAEIMSDLPSHEPEASQSKIMNNMRRLLTRQ